MFVCWQDLVEHVNQLNDFEDSMVRKNSRPDPNLALYSTCSYLASNPIKFLLFSHRLTTGYKWLDKEVLESHLMEIITPKEYDSFLNAMEKLLSLPYSYKVSDFIAKYRTPLMSQTKNQEIPQLKYEADGRAYITTYGSYLVIRRLSKLVCSKLRKREVFVIIVFCLAECLRKRARGDVTIRSPGTGKVTINGESIDYFERVENREQVSNCRFCHWLYVAIQPWY